MKNQGFINQKPQFKASGNAFVIILIVIALLGALTVTVTRMGDTQDDVSQEEAQVIASKVLRQAQTMASAVESLRSNGCSINGLSFENNKAAGYSNAQSPADKSCWLFDAAGAGLTFPTPPSKSNNGSNWHIGRNFSVIGVGPERETSNGTTTGTCTASLNCQDLVAVLPLVDAKVCQAINLLTGVTSSYATPVPAAGFSMNLRYKFSAPSTSPDASNFSLIQQGTFPIYSPATPVTTGAFYDKKAGCINSPYYYDESATLINTTNSYFFYQVLAER